MLDGTVKRRILALACPRREQRDSDAVGLLFTCQQDAELFQTHRLGIGLFLSWSADELSADELIDCLTAAHEVAAPAVGHQS